MSEHISRWVSPHEAASRLGVGRTKLYELVKAGKIEVRKLGKRTIIDLHQVDRFAEGLPLVGQKAQAVTLDQEPKTSPSRTLARPLTAEPAKAGGHS